ncbi:MAG: hypothetical protein ACJAR9_000767 [Celeribacter sp.]|jgi:hypothetical protein
MNDEANSIFGLSPPPRASDVLFGGNPQDWRLNACIEHWGNVEYAYKAGFRKGAFQLAERMCTEPNDQDLLVYPIAYLYRHHIEMVLKSIFHLSLEVLDEEISGRQKKKLVLHDLTRLWGMIKPKLSAICTLANEAPLPKEDLEGIEAYMHQLNAQDPNGESFRYARQNDSKRTLNEDLMRINIRSFAINMEKLANYLEGLENWLAALAYAEK